MNEMNDEQRLKKLKKSSKILSREKSMKQQERKITR